MKLRWVALGLSLSGLASTASAADLFCHIPSRSSILQANGITVNLRLIDRNQDGRLTGEASFISTAMRGDRVIGDVEGIENGRDLRLRIHWSYRGAARGGPFGLGVDRFRYDETGIYNGHVNENGELRGTTYPYERPNARYSWFMRGYVQCDR
jgi:hypothetical protein